MTKFDFSNQQVTGKSTARYDLSEIEGVYDSEADEYLEPYLIVRPATQSNKQYFKEVVKQAPKFARGMQGKKRIDPKTLENARDDDRELYAQSVVAGWGNIPDADGNAAALNVENIHMFLKALPDWIFDRIRAFCGTEENFVKGNAPTPEDHEANEGN